MITNRTLSKLKPQSKPYFLRSKSLVGFGVKVNPTGSIRFIVETRHSGKVTRKTIGAYPVMSLYEAEEQAIVALKNIHTGYIEPKALGTVLGEYTTTVSLKPSTLKNYKEVIGYYLADWLTVPMAEINKGMFEEKRGPKVSVEGHSGD